MGFNPIIISMTKARRQETRKHVNKAFMGIVASSAGVGGIAGISGGVPAGRHKFKKYVRVNTPKHIKNNPNFKASLKASSKKAVPVPHKALFFSTAAALGGAAYFHHHNKKRKELQKLR